MEFISENIKPIVSSIGLFLDIVGVIVVFKFGVPSLIDGSKIPINNADDTVTKIGSDHGKMAYVGVSILIIGFSLQIISNWL